MAVNHTHQYPQIVGTPSERSDRDLWNHINSYNQSLNYFPLDTGIEYLESAAANCFFFFNGKTLPKADELDWSLPVCEDIHMVLQFFKLGYNNRVWDRFGYISNILVDGGCNEWRTLKLINDTHEKLISYYPNHVSWNGIRENVMGGDFKKIKIKWKRMYQDSQIFNLEEFI